MSDDTARRAMRLLKFMDSSDPAVQPFLEALAAYQSMGAPRADLRPRMAQAYARYWGRFRDFAEVEAFEQIRKR